MPTATDSSERPLTTLPFPPLTATHILNCSFHSWYPKLRQVSPKARVIPLTDPFLDYLRADGIVLPPDVRRDDDSGYSDDEDEMDPAADWRDLHDEIVATVKELGKAVPKLNWSAPKDATWIATTNDMECRSANDIYLLLKSSDFVTHDLEHALEGCIDTAPIPYHLALRKSFVLNPALEFRCFVRDRRLIAVSQREMNHFDFLSTLRESFKAKIEDFLEDHLLPNFPDPDFVFDVYIPPPHEKVWLIDINPWAQRTDPLLFSWLELLTMPVPDDDDAETEEEIFDPEFRLVARDDPEANLASAKYSAHKLPREVVDAGMTPSAMKDMMEEWKKVMDKGGQDGESDEEDD
ncbi:uncharacterized protein AB675_175 [Cyphellophora attinorum]|uniref:Uncharacterized protein n=1 Tax=Cyphellophora attinorum TaxID=1664694 RepID=A0A0N1H0Z1_9EURO|nr:uncharacterized protein AB675_175 [Phialophora attinorum]KPI37777.1 hypothetical protein AB675_175 [Phialophora attinorum]